MNSDALRARDIHGWGTDPDLPDRPDLRERRVEIRRHDVSGWDLDDYLGARVGPAVGKDGKDDPDYAYEHGVIQRYAALYETFGPWAMPPIVIYELGPKVQLVLTGEHRQVAASVAGLEWIPAAVILQ